MKVSLLATTMIGGIAAAAPAYGQTTAPGATLPQQPPSQTADSNEAQVDPKPQAPAPGQPVAGTQADQSGDAAIVVTGTILRATKKATPSPVQVIDMKESEKRGITTVNDAIQSISANGAGTMPNAWNANGNFAQGASAASLRGLLTSNTLVLFDGLRAAYYPLADDGTRNFVDLNTVPDAIVDRVEVLKDGASSTYGADAIAGVINIITKRQVKGFNLDGSMGVSQYGDAEERNLSATYGFGDLERQGFNVYVNANYYKIGGIRQSDRDYPYNTGNLCNDPKIGYNTGYYFGSCNLNIVTSPAFFVRPSGPNNDIAASDADNPARSDYQALNPAIGCLGRETYNLTAADAAANPSYPGSVCADDWVHNYFSISAPLERWGGSARVTKRISDSVEGYATVNFIRTHTWYDGYLGQLRRSTPPLIGPLISTTTLALPVYICPDGVDCANDPDRVLNPQNPFASQGSQARIVGMFPGINEGNDVKTRGIRGAAGVSGDLGGFRFSVDGTAMKVRTRISQTGVAYIANLLQAVNTGTLNFVNPLANSQDVLDFVFPENISINRSSLYQLQGSLARDILQLPGGPLQLGVGASIRHESVNSPSANPERDSEGNVLSTDISNLDQIDPYQRWTDRINPFGVIGKRTVKSVYAELQAPILRTLDVNVSGRYDSYNTGQHAFSPKLGAKFTPIREVAFRGTWSKGFRIGSFAESFGLPTTGYITGANTVPDSYAAHFEGGSNNPYLANYSLGLTQVGNPNLKPEHSRNMTLGVVAEPIRNISFSVDYWDIKKKDVITGADYTGALAAYYAGEPIPDGFQVLPDVTTPSPIPGVIDRAAFVRYSFVNAASQRAKGIDFAANAKVRLGDGVTFSSSLEASRMLKLNTCFDSGCQKYVGTLGPYGITSASGTPKLRGSWQNTLTVHNVYAALTAFYTSGYKLTAEDVTGPGTGDDCANSLGATFNDGHTQCRVKKTLYFNAAAGVDVNDKFTIYANVNDLFNKKPPLDTGTYGGYLYNPAWSQPMMVGRYFRVGVKIHLAPSEAAAPAPVMLPPAPEPAPATQTCADGSVILATDTCPAPAPAPTPAPPPPPAANGERGQ